MSYVNLFTNCFAANAVSIWILTSKYMRSCFNIQLAALAAFDFLYLLVTILIFGLPTLSTWYKSNVYPWVVPIA